MGKKKLGLVLVLVIILVGCGDKTEKMESDVSTGSWDQEAQVVVIGAGSAGLSAAIEAHANGVTDITVLEKTNRIGGVSFLSQGMIAGYDTEVAKKSNVSITPEDMYDVLMSNAKYRLDPHLAAITVQKSGESVDWLINEIGVEFNDEILVGYGPLQMMHVMSEGGMSMHDPFTNKIEEAGVNLQLSTQAISLLKDNNGKISGVLAINPDGKEIRIKADAVIVATGGYAANGDLAGNLNPSYQGIIGIGHSPNEGDGLIMASDFGAGIAHTDHLMAVMKDYIILSEMNGNSNTATVSRLLRAESLIFVGSDGKRFMDEKDAGFMSQDLNQPVLDQMKKDGENFVWVITDQNGMDTTEAVRGLDQEFITANTVAELAMLMNVDATALDATVIEWNEITTGVTDVFGRTAGLVPVKAPFYAVAIAPAPIITYGGIMRTDHGEVTNVNGDIIDGLYAAGEAAANSAYMGFTLSNAVTWGRIAGTSVADYLVNGPRSVTEKLPTKTVMSKALILVDGVHIGVASGNGGELKVEVVVDGGILKSVTVLEHNETESIAGLALQKIPQQIVEKQSLEVDAVAGATITGGAIVRAVENALKS